MESLARLGGNATGFALTVEDVVRRGAFKVAAPLRPYTTGRCEPARTDEPIE
jgi:hypothetical protein